MVVTRGKDPICDMYQKIFLARYKGELRTLTSLQYALDIAKRKVT